MIVDKVEFDIEYVHEAVLTGSVVGAAFKGQQIRESSVIVRYGSSSRELCRFSVSGYSDEQERTEMVMDRVKDFVGSREQEMDPILHESMAKRDRIFLAASEGEGPEAGLVVGVEKSSWFRRHVLDRFKRKK